MPVVEVKPLSEKPADCEHLSYLVDGVKMLAPDRALESRLCGSCKQRFTATVELPPVDHDPQPEKPLDCEHVAWEVSGEAKLPGNRLHEHRKCTDCGHSWTVTTDAEPEPTAEEHDEVKTKPPTVVYGGGRIVTYQTEHGQHDLVLDEIAMVSLQAGVLVVQHPGGDVKAIVGVRPWMQEEGPHADAEG